MAAKKKAAKAGAAAGALKGSPYVQRLVEDEDLRENLRTAVEASRNAYGRLANGKAPQKVILDDKRFQKDMRTAAEALREVGDALREGPQRKKRRGSGLGKLLLLAVVGGVAAVALSEDLRNKLLDALFGAEEEFDYSSTTQASSAQTAPSTSPATSA